MDPETEKEATYVMLGEEGFYTFSDPWNDLARQIGFMTYCGFTLIGIDGVNGFRVDPRQGVKNG